MYKTHQRHRTRNALWGGSESLPTADTHNPPEENQAVTLLTDALRNFDGSDAEMIIEAWDFQKHGKDRLIGRAMVAMDEVIAAKDAGVDVSLVSADWADRQDAADVFYAVAGCGIAKRSGTINIRHISTGECTSTDVAQGDIEALREAESKSFDIDAKLELHRRGKLSDALSWVPLSMRRVTYQAEMRSGQEIVDKSFLSDVTRTTRELWQFIMYGCGAAVSGFTMRHSYFYRSQATMGAEFGSAMRAFFAFSHSVIVSNLILWLLWVPAWLPQALFVRVHPLQEFLSVFSFANVTIKADDVQTGVLFFSGYMPKALMHHDSDTNEPVYYPIGTIYLLCAFASLISMLSLYTLRLYRQIRHPSLAVSSSSALPTGTGQILNAMFGGWDYQHYGAEETNKTRKELITKVKEGEAEAERDLNKSSAVITRAERNRILLRRVLLISLAIVLTGGGATLIIFCLIPGPFHTHVLEPFAKLVPVVGPLLDTIIITTINMVVPVVIKTLVKKEEWSPGVKMRQTLLRIFVVKMVNATAIFLNLGLIDEAAKPFNDRECVEKHAAETYLKLIITDFIAVSLTFSIPKYLKLVLKPKLSYCCSMWAFKRKQVRIGMRGHRHA